MSQSYTPKKLRQKIILQARRRCGYCLTSELIVGYEMDIEHIIPESLGGLTVENNLWFSCSDCNGFKGSKISAIDPISEELLSLFNPRTQAWTEHFEWSKEGDLIIGKTAIGRATVIALKLNRQFLLDSRQMWVSAGWHPPKD
jgi:5-methylcytosine-specific restriction endonuclease McrA